MTTLHLSTMKNFSNSKNAYNKRMVYFKFDDMLISSKDFYKNKQAIDIYQLNECDIIVSDPVPVNNGRDKKYLIGYKKGNMIVPLLLKTPKDVYCTRGVTRYDENSKYSMSFLLDDHLEWKSKYNSIWHTIDREIGKSLTIEPIKNECFLNGKIRCYKDEILSNFHKQGSALRYPMSNIKCIMY